MYAEQMTDVTVKNVRQRRTNVCRLCLPSFGNTGILFLRIDTIALSSTDKVGREPAGVKSSDHIYITGIYTRYVNSSHNLLKPEIKLKSQPDKTERWTMLHVSYGKHHGLMSKKRRNVQHGSKFQLTQITIQTSKRSYSCLQVFRMLTCLVARPC